MMDGRVKTLHPKVHGGILGRRGTDDAIMQQHGIEGIDMVVVNLYPFAATVAKPKLYLRRCGRKYRYRPVQQWYVLQRKTIKMWRLW